MDTEQGIERALLQHAERQTKALENIQWIVVFMFVMGLIAAGIWLISLLHGSGAVA